MAGRVDVLQKNRPCEAERKGGKREEKRRKKRERREKKEEEREKRKEGRREREEKRRKKRERREKKEEEREKRKGSREREKREEKEERRILTVQDRLPGLLFQTARRPKEVSFKGSRSLLLNNYQDLGSRSSRDTPPSSRSR